MHTIKVAVVGLGFFGEVHAEVYNSLPMTDLVAVCDIDHDRLSNIAKKSHAEAYLNYRKLLEKEEIDLVDICLPDDSHTKAILDAIDTSKHILVEKPLASNLKDAALIATETEEYDKKFMVAHLVRFDSRSMKAYEKINAGEIGEILHATSRRNSPISGGKYYARHCSLATHSGIHDLDLLRWLVGSNYKSVYAKARSRILKEEGYDVEDSILALFEFNNGVIYSFENCWTLPEDFPSMLDAKVEIIGTNGVIHIDVFNHGLSIYTKDRHEDPDLFHWPEIDGIRSGAITREITHFVNCILYDKQPKCSALDGYYAVEAAVKIQESIAEDERLFFEDGKI